MFYGYSILSPMPKCSSNTFVLTSPVNPATARPRFRPRTTTSAPDAAEPAPETLEGSSFKPSGSR